MPGRTEWLEPDWQEFHVGGYAIMKNRVPSTAGKRSSADDRMSKDRVARNFRDKPLTEVKPGQPTMDDEAGDVSIANADNPMSVREEVKNTSDSSGLRADDEARGEQIKKQLKRGAREIQPLD
jgi:hypothetical protein